MSDKLKLTKDSLSKEKKALARFSRFLPTLKLRKTQLFNEIHRIRESIDEAESEFEALTKNVACWSAVFAQDIDTAEFCKAEKALVRTGNVAGIEIPMLSRIDFREATYDLMTHPFWLDTGLDTLKQTITRKVQLQILREQLAIISEELRTTVQRINLFEKVKIPQTQENIRRIRIFLGDVQTAGVVRGKMTKAKLTRKRKVKKAVATA